jgi:hypothetical protein
VATHGPKFDPTMVKDAPTGWAWTSREKTKKRERWDGGGKRAKQAGLFRLWAERGQRGEVRRAHKWLRQSSTTRVGEASGRKIGRRDAWVRRKLDGGVGWA